MCSRGSGGAGSDARGLSTPAAESLARERGGRGGLEARLSGERRGACLGSKARMAQLEVVDPPVAAGCGQGPMETALGGDRQALQWCPIDQQLGGRMRGGPAMDPGSLNGMKSVWAAMAPFAESRQQLIAIGIEPQGTAGQIKALITTPQADLQHGTGAAFGQGQRQGAAQLEPTRAGQSLCLKIRSGSSCAAPWR